MPTELKIRKVRSITISGVQSGAHGDGKFARVLTVRSEDGHIYNVTLISDRAEWLELEDNGDKRGRRHGNGGKEAAGRSMQIPAGVEIRVERVSPAA
jgi:hypothetical protein